MTESTRIKIKMTMSHIAAKAVAYGFLAVAVLATGVASAEEGGAMQ